MYRLYESEGIDTAAVDQSGSSALQFSVQYGTEAHYTLSAPATDGFMYIQLSDPYGGQKEVIRSDGKYIK